MLRIIKLLSKLRVVAPLFLSITCCFSSLTYAEKGERYDPSFFTVYSVQTAFDMVNRLPGFKVDLGKSVRGFSGGAGNILIDGARLSAKSGGLKEALLRIPAQQVAYIEINRSASGVGDASGKAMVANIVRVPQLQAGQYSITLSKAGQDVLFPEAQISYVTQLGQWQSNFKGDIKFKDIPSQSEYELTSQAGRHLNNATEVKKESLNEIFISGDASRQQQDEQQQFTFRVGKSQYRPQLQRTTTTLNSIEVLHNDRDSVYHTAEAGFNWSLPVANWRLKHLGIVNFTHWTVDRQTEAFIDTVPRYENYDFQRNKWESIYRGTAQKKHTKSSQELGVELTYNYANNNTRYLKTQNNVQQVVQLPAANVEIKEQRAEVFYNHAWQLDSTTGFNAGIALEHSSIEVKGDASNQDDYLFIKPSLAYSHQLTPQWQGQVQFNRVVNQLSFKLFAAQSNAEANRQQAGNPALKPDSYYRLSVDSNYQLSDKNVIKMTLFGQWHQDGLEYQILPSGAEGIANGGNARVMGINLDISLGLDFVLPNGVMDIEFTTQKSSYSDPITLTDRAINQQQRPTLKAQIRQDIIAHDFSWGVNYIGKNTRKNYYVSEYVELKEQDDFDAFIEYKGFGSSVITFTVSQLNRAQSMQYRHFYSPNRSGVLSQSELRDKRHEQVVSLNYATTF